MGSFCRKLGVLVVTGFIVAGCKTTHPSDLNENETARTSTTASGEAEAKIKKLERTLSDLEKQLAEAEADSGSRPVEPSQEVPLSLAVIQDLSAELMATTEESLEGSRFSSKAKALDTPRRLSEQTSILWDEYLDSDDEVIQSNLAATSVHFLIHLMTSPWGYQTALVQYSSKRKGLSMLSLSDEERATLVSMVELIKQSLVASHGTSDLLEMTLQTMKFDTLVTFFDHFHDQELIAEVIESLAHYVAVSRFDDQRIAQASAEEIFDVGYHILAIQMADRAEAEQAYQSFWQTNRGNSLSYAEETSSLSLYLRSEYAKIQKIAIIPAMTYFLADDYDLDWNEVFNMDQKEAAPFREKAEVLVEVRPISLPVISRKN